MDSTKHLLLTRFNVASPGRQQAIRLRPGWLEKRFQLFEEFCLPSVKSQTVQDFEWIIFFDSATPDEFKRQIAELQKTYPFRAEYTELFEMNKLCPQLVAENKGAAQWLITTRLDSDDILASNFMESMRSKISFQRKEIVNFANGIILSLEGGKKRLYLDRDEANPFASLIEPFTDDIDTIWGRQHREIAEMAPVIQVEGEPLWLQIVHGDNVTNRIKGKRVRIADHTAHFPYLAALVNHHRENRQEIELENLLLAPLRRAKEELRALAKRLLRRK